MGMAVAGIKEIKAGSPEGFEEAIQVGIDYATEQFGDVQSAWVKEQEAVVRDGSIVDYRVDLKITYMAET